MNKKGFTITELIIILSLIGILTAIAIPSYFSWLPRQRIRTSVRNIYDAMNMAKFRAVRTGTVTSVAFNINNDTYTIFLDANGNLTEDGGDTVIRAGTMENGVDIYASTIPQTGGFYTYGFNNRGMAQTAAGVTPAGDVRLTNPSGLFMAVRVNTAGGLSIIRSPDSGSTWPD